MNYKWLGFSAMLALAAPVSGCLTTGELGGGSFGYVCNTQGNDAACDSAFPGPEPPVGSPTLLTWSIV